MRRLIPAFLILVSCSQPEVESQQIEAVYTPAQAKADIKKTDSAMSALAAQEGFLKALLFYADSNMIKFNDGQHPVIGIAKFQKFANERPSTKSIAWEPRFVDVAASCDLGYTWGNWKLTTPDTAYYGNYFTVWKRQKDGTWKHVLDGGNNTPAN
jgi:ketosteroid isomerase-like protein